VLQVKEQLQPQLLVRAVLKRLEVQKPRLLVVRQATHAEPKPERPREAQMVHQSQVMPELHASLVSHELLQTAVVHMVQISARDLEAISSAMRLDFHDALQAL
jgi:hypothetical protein